MNEDTKQVITISVATVIVVGIIFGGITSCSTMANRQLTDRVKTVCDADLTKDVARAIACNNLSTQRGF